MAVTAADVRTALNEISVDELKDSTINQKIADAQAKFSGYAEGAAKDRSVRNYAAYLSFLISNYYVQMRLGPLSAKREVEEKARILKSLVDEAVGEMTGTSQVIFKRTLMYDDRMSDEDEGISYGDDEL